MPYYLYQISTHAQHDKLTRIQLVHVLRKGKNPADWLCWTPGFSQWKNIETCPDILEWVNNQWKEDDPAPAIPVEHIARPITELPVFVEAANQSADEFEIVDPKTKNKAKPDTETQAPLDDAEMAKLRKHARIKGRLRTILTNKAKAFITYSKDISLGGISVEHSIPKEILQGEIEVYISDPTGRKSIVFNCHPVGETDNPTRFTFSKTDSKQLAKLTTWLDELEKGKAS